MIRRTLFATLVCVAALLLCANSGAEMLTVSGEGKAPISDDIATTQSAARKDAKRDALLEQIRKYNGAASPKDPKVQEAVGIMLKQFGDDLITNESSERIGSDFVIRVTLSVDQGRFIEILDRVGIGNDAHQLSPILVVMDEFFTVATDKTKPLPSHQQVEFNSDKASNFNLSDQQSSNSSAAANLDAHASGTVSRESENAFQSGLSGAARQTAASQASESGINANAARNDTANRNLVVGADNHESVAFRMSVDYQPQNLGPEKQSYTYNALLRESTRYSLKLLDNDLFRSRYFEHGKALTLDELQNGSELARYVKAAHDEFNADYFMVGNAIIIQGRQLSNGQVSCDGLMTLKAYATADGEVLTADSRTESASGNTPDQCRANVANKMAKYSADTVGGAIRSRPTGSRRYTIRLVSLLGNLSEDNKDDFTDILDSIKDVKNSKVRGSDHRMYEVSLIYGGDGDLGREIRRAAIKKFPNIGRSLDGSTLQFCLEAACPGK